MACAGDAGGKEAPQGHRRSAHHLQRDHPQRHPLCDGPSARARSAADRGLYGPSRTGLSGGLQPLPRAVAQAAGQQIGRPRAIRRPAADLRTRGGDRGLQNPRILVRRSCPRHPRRRALRCPADASEWPQARSVRSAEPGQCRSRPRPGAGRQACRAVGGTQARPPQPATALHHLHPATGRLTQARPVRPADHASGAAAL